MPTVKGWKNLYTIEQTFQFKGGAGGITNTYSTQPNL
jgi:hypothetical protein